MIKSNIHQQAFGSLIAVSMMVIPFATSVQAQTNEVEPGIAVVETEDNSFDWGLLGLLGLLGLAGLAGKNNHKNHEVRSTEDFPEAPATRNDIHTR